MKKIFDILGLGGVAVDELLYVKNYPPADDKAEVLRRERQCGGITAIALMAGARLGSKCAYAGVLGKDELSGFAIGQMRREGINLKYLSRRASASLIHSVIVNDRTHKTRNIFFDEAGMVGADRNWPEEKVIQSARVLYVDWFTVPGMVRAARIARKTNIPIVADFEQMPGGAFSTLVGLVDHLIVSESFAARWTGEKDPRRALKKLWKKDRQLVAVTSGEKGCWFLTAEQKLQHQAAFKVNVVDTTGCGDVFHGAYASALARGMDAPERIRFAAAAAALKATKPGAQRGIPTLDAVEKIL